MHLTVAELAPGVRRVTQPLPIGIGHVHCYLLRGACANKSQVTPLSQVRWLRPSLRARRGVDC